MAIEDRLRRLEGDNPPRCEDAPCQQAIVTTQRVIHEDDTEEVIGDPPPPFCATCPEHSKPQPRITQIEIIADYRSQSSH